MRSGRNAAFATSLDKISLEFKIKCLHFILFQFMFSLFQVKKTFFMFLVSVNYYNPDIKYILHIDVDTVYCVRNCEKAYNICIYSG